MALNEPKMRSITGKLVANKLTERDDDFSFNVTYQANRSVKDLCKLAATTVNLRRLSWRVPITT